MCDLAKVGKPGQLEDDRTTASGVDGADKFERIYNKMPLHRAFRDENLEKEKTELRKKMSLAARECPEWQPKLERHLANLAGASEWVIAKMLLRDDTKGLIAIHESMSDALQDGKLPKENFINFGLVTAAMQCMPPWRPVPELPKLLGLVKLQEAPKVPYSIHCPSLNADYIDVDDLHSGIVPSRWVHFWELYVISKFLSLGDKWRRPIVDFLVTHMVPYLRGLPAEFDAPCLKTFLKQVLGLLLAIGYTPLAAGATQEDLQEFLSGGRLKEIATRTKWTAKLVDCVHMNLMGENKSWPEVTKKTADILSGDVDKGYAAVDGMLESYSTWQAQLRVTAFEEYIHPHIVSFLQARLEMLATPSGDAEPRVDPSSAEVRKVVGYLHMCNSMKFASQQLKDLLRGVAHVTQAMMASANLEKLMGVLLKSKGSDLQADASSFEAFCKQLQGGIPESPATVVIPGQSCTEASSILREFGKALLLHWPTPQWLYDCVVAMHERVPISEDGIEKETKEAFAEAQANMKTYRRLQGFHEHVELLQKMGPMRADTVEEKNRLTTVLKCVAYQVFCQGEEFRSQQLPETCVNQVNDLLTRSTTMVGEFKTFYYSDARATLDSHREIVWKIRGGTETGDLWFDNVPAESNWQDFLALTLPSLRRLDKPGLVKATFELDQVSWFVAACLP